MTTEMLSDSPGDTRSLHRSLGRCLFLSTKVSIRAYSGDAIYTLSSPSLHIGLSIGSRTGEGCIGLYGCTCRECGWLRGPGMRVLGAYGCLDVLVLDSCYRLAIAVRVTVRSWLLLEEEDAHMVGSCRLFVEQHEAPVSCVRSGIIFSEFEGISGTIMSLQYKTLF